jgi:RES domain-containing protein
MQVYRVASSRFAMDLTGEGARIAGGRWNPKGMAVIYTAEHSALAMLEIMAHLDRSCAPNGLQLATITIPDNLETYSPSLDELPEDWASTPNNMSAVLFGKKWLQQAAAPVLKVPSIMTPYGEGWNLLLNPIHPDLLGKMSVMVRNWVLDPRLFPAP